MTVLSLLLESLLCLYLFKYCYQIYRIHRSIHRSIHGHKSPKESDRCGQWLWFYSQNRGLRSLWTCNFSQILDSTQFCIFYKKSFLWLFSLKYCYMRHGALDEYESLKELDRYDQWFWFYSKNRGFRYLWTGRYCFVSSLQIYSIFVTFDFTAI